MKKMIIVFGCISVVLMAQSIDSNSSYIDDTHSIISKKVVDLSNEIDTTLSSWLGHSDSNTTNKTIAKKKKKERLTVDAFFQSNKYFNETDNTFIRVRTDSILQTRESNKLNLRVSAQIPFNKSRQNFQFFVNDLNLENTANILQNEDVDQNAYPNIGMHYFAPVSYGITSRYSLGFQGITPFVRARYSKIFRANEWNIEPAQIFRYSSDNIFEEETNIYIDKEFSELSLLRIQLHRQTKTDIKGMDYALAVEYYWSPQEKTGLRVSQGFYGNTKYPYIVDKNIDPPVTDTFGGINNYATSFSWRQNIWRDWFYYEVTPSVNFHKDHEYQANYAVRFFLDFYFGEYK
ncbi:MAG: hypothetical protein FAF03_10670 [Epsilonproteobacteria bacterium]|nr:hypothetical protein [Campylobacterota bacterium]